MENEAKQEDPREHRQKRFLRAAYLGNFEEVQRLLPDVDINGTLHHIQPSGVTALFCAAEEGKTSIVSLLLERNADPSIADGNGQTPLLMAISKKKNEVITALVQAKAPIDAMMLEGAVSPLLLACDEGAQDIVAILINAKADVNLQSKDKKSPLGLATRKGHPALVKTLLEAKANAALVEAENNTPLHWAAGRGQESVVRILLNADAPAPVNAINDRQRSPLHYACYCGSIECANMLLESKADIQAKDAEGYSPLLLAIYFKQASVEFIQLLLERRADVHVRFPNGSQALDVAENAAIRQLLLAHVQAPKDGQVEVDEGKGTED
jgi:ankyrin repeat protein